MSTEAEFNAAYTNLYDQVHAPHFFEKLAQRGIVPQDVEEQQQLLNMGAQLHAAAQAGRLNQSAAPSLIKAGAANLAGELGNPQPQGPSDADYLAVAAQYAQQDAELVKQAGLLATIE